MACLAGDEPAYQLGDVSSSLAGQLGCGTALLAGNRCREVQASEGSDAGGRSGRGAGGRTSGSSEARDVAPALRALRSAAVRWSGGIGPRVPSLTPVGCEAE